MNGNTMPAGDIRRAGTVRAGLLEAVRRRGWVLVVCAAVFALAASATARASTFNVNTTSDTAASTAECAGVPGDCSLRQAIDKAGSGAGADTIFVPSGQYKLTLGQLVIGAPQSGLVIIGAGARDVVIDGSSVNGSGGTRVFDVQTEASISQLTITHGHADPTGGGIQVESGGSLTLSNSTVSANIATGSSTNGSGGGIYNAGTLDASGATITGNTATTLTANPVLLGMGGGIYNAGSSLTLRNDTIDGNSAGGSLPLGNGGGLATNAAASPTLTNVTLTRNRTGFGGTGSNLFTAAGSASPTVHNTIVAQGTGAAANCSAPAQSTGNNLEDANSCSFNAAGDRPGTTSPGLGPLADNGGPTDTRALLAGSPAIDAGSNTNCPATDQRGLARPQGPSCDIGAYELAVGSAIIPPSHTTLPSSPSVPGATFPPAVLGKTFNLVPVSGTVRYLLPNGQQYNPLLSAVQAPLGTIVEASKGRARVISARNSAGLQQNADFYDGPFQVRQSLEARKPGKPRTGITDLFLRFGDFRDCDRADRKQIQAVAARKRRRLWGRGRGSYRTRGNYGSASVRGTWWFTKDLCDGTEFYVREGVLKVRDNTRRKTITLRAGGRYLAEAPPDHVLPKRGSQ
jgi:hypothetical protein